jgi:NADPH2:quinone reductase
VKAIVCKQFGPFQELQIAELPDPTVGPRQVLIDVAAAGVNFLDTLIVEGRYQVRPALPFAPGGEVSGVVRSVGAGVEGLRSGQRVAAMAPYGGFATQLVANADSVFPIPDFMTFLEAAGFLIAYGTSYHALYRRANLRKGERLLVLGAAGGVGLSAVEIGKRLGATIIAAASSDEKLARCAQYGADELVNYSSGDVRARLKDLTAGKGVDVVYDPVGGPFAEQAIRSLAFLGRYLVVGFAAGEVPKIATNLLLLKSAAAVGVAWGAFAEKYPRESAADIQTLMSWHADGYLRPFVSAVYSLDQCVNALETLVHRRAHGKVVLQIDPQMVNG